MQTIQELRNPSKTQQLRSQLAYSPPSSSKASHYQRQALARAYDVPWDRVNVLGDEACGHTGCVNALSWAQDGELLISAGDDTTVRLWRMEREDTETPYPFKCDAVIRTGHQANIFNAQMLPSSSKIATVAGDKQVRVLDVERPLSLSTTGHETPYTTQQTCTRVLKCHTGRTKRIITESSPDQFLTVAEDGTVRQHDLRTHHRCSPTTCPQPLVTLPHDLSALALSPLAPYYFVVGGESECGYLFDRRQIGRVLHYEWGVPVNDADLTTCVRRFGRTNRGPGEVQGSEHITGARMAQTNGHEVLLSYSGDAVYLYSTRDDPQDRSSTHSISPILAPNAKKRRPATPDDADGGGESSNSDVDTDMNFNMFNLPTLEDVSDTEGDESEDIPESAFRQQEIPERFKAPQVFPRSRFAGACNVETVKDVNFIGPNDDFVASGSDDGNFFLWRKNTGRIHGVYEGDSNVVNVIEGHPRYPLLAVSGIDTTVKLFSLANGELQFNRTSESEEIANANVRTSRRSARRGLSSLFFHYQLALREAGINSDDQSQCTFQ